MPVLPLKPFLAYKQSEFRIGGNPAEVFEFARRWRVFAENALTTAASLRAMNDGGFLGDEGDRYRELIHGEFPNHLTITGESHRGVSTAVTQYAEALTTAQTQMNALIVVALADHTAVQTAVTNYNLCEANVIRAAATAKVATATAVATAALPGVNAITASTATAAQSELAAAQAAFEAAKAEHLRATTVFDADVAKGAGIKSTLSMEVDTAVAWIKTQARRRFEENPNWVEEKWEAFKDWVSKHADLLRDISDVLQSIGGLLASLPILNGLGLSLKTLGLELKGLLCLTGNCSWQEFASDMTTFLPRGKLLDALKGTRPGKALSDALGAAKEKLGMNGPKNLCRGNECKFPGMEPVDMATGAMIDSATDVRISGMLPMVVARNTDSGMDTSRVFGPGWNTTLDCRIEILPGQILMMTPDGALLEFPPAPVDGTEVGDAGRPWRLCFVDGAYRVRNIQEGVTYVFGVAGSETHDGEPCYRPEGPVPDYTITGDAPRNYVYRLDGETGELTRRERTIEDESHDNAVDEDHSDGVADKTHAHGMNNADMDGREDSTSDTHESANDRVNADAANPQDDSDTNVDGSGVWEASNSFVNMLASGSVADTFNLGVEVQLSTVIHHSGAWIEYNYEQETGHLVTMRRSDGTVLELKWHNRISRLLSIWVRNEETHPGSEPFRLASYNYDGKGRLLKVINSAAGALRYFYDDEHRPFRWTDRNGHSYHYRFDEKGRVTAQVGSGGMFPNIAVWLKDTGDDAPEDGTVCVALECAGEFHGNPTEIGDTCINEYFDRLGKLPLANLLREKGLVGAGLTGRGRAGTRDNEPWSLSDELLHDEFLGDIRPTVYRSTPTGDVWRVITPEGVVTDREFDEHHQIIKEVSNTGVVTTIERDEYGTVTRIDFGDGTTETITPGAWGEPLQITGRDGLVTEYEVDAAGMVTSITDLLGVVTQFEYDWRATGIVPKATITPNGLVRGMECDNAGRPIASTDPAGRRSSVTRDVCGLITETIDPVGNTTTIEYSPEGWATKVINPDGSERSASYDGEGNQIGFVNEAGAITTAKYTVFDRLCEVITVDGGVTKYSYNTQMEPIMVTNADGHTWWFEYDLDGEVIKETDYNGLVTETHRSQDGLRVDIVDGEETITTHYDIFGLLTEVHEIDDVVRFTRDKLGEITQVSNKWSTVNYQHDEYNRPISEVTTLYSGEQSTITLHYDADATIDAVTHVLPDGQEVTETPSYDEYGQLQRLTHYINKRECAIMSFGVDDIGRRSWCGIDSVVRKFEFDNRDRITSDTMVKLGGNTATSIIDRVFSWRVDDVLEQVKDTVRDITIDYAADSSGRVTSVTHVDAVQDQKLSESYGFSRAGMLTKLHPDTSAKWADDVDSYGGTMPRQIGRTTFTYDKAGRVIQTVTKRLSKKPLVKHFYYGSGTQPVGYEDSDHPGVGWRYLYDGLSRRVGKERIDTATGDVLSRVVFMHQGNRLFGEQYTVNSHDPHVVGSGKLWPVDPLTGDVMGQIEFTNPNSVDGWSQDQVDAVFYAMVSDLTGAPKELVDVTTGGIVGYSKQSLFGKRTWFGGKSSPLLFAGQYEDAESGWVYNRFRYYNAAFGMYNAQDPLGVGPNLASAQAYVDNPTTWVDIYGLQSHKKNRRKGTIPQKSKRGRSQNPPGPQKIFPRPSSTPPDYVTEFSYHAEQVRMKERGVFEQRVRDVVTSRRKFEWQADKGTWKITDKDAKLVVCITDDGKVVTVMRP